MTKTSCKPPTPQKGSRDGSDEDGMCGSGPVRRRKEGRVVTAERSRVSSWSPMCSVSGALLLSRSLDFSWFPDEMKEHARQCVVLFIHSLTHSFVRLSDSPVTDCSFRARLPCARICIGSVELQAIGRRRLNGSCPPV